MSFYLPRSRFRTTMDPYRNHRKLAESLRKGSVYICSFVSALLTSCFERLVIGTPQKECSTRLGSDNVLRAPPMR
jgi:hypothetical protein